MPPSHRTFSAWHDDDTGRRVEHDVTTLRDGPTRALVTRWAEDGRWGLDVSERTPGSFAGALEFPGSAMPIRALCDVTEIDGHLQVHVTARYDGATWAWTIHAVENRD